MLVIKLPFENIFPDNPGRGSIGEECRAENGWLLEKILYRAASLLKILLFTQRLEGFYLFPGKHWLHYSKALP